MIRAQSVLAAALLLLSPLAAAAQDTPSRPADAPRIENGSTVRLEYTLRDSAATVLDSNVGAQPLSYTQGRGQIIPGLERQLHGMHAGEEKQIVLPPEDAYGAVNPAAQAEVPKHLLPPEALVVGARLIAQSSTGERRPVAVKEIKSETVVLDLNHPLAGKTLFFDIKVLGVDPPERSTPPAAETPAPGPKPEK